MLENGKWSVTPPTCAELVPDILLTAVTIVFIATIRSESEVNLCLRIISVQFLLG